VTPFRALLIASAALTLAAGAAIQIWTVPILTIPGVGPMLDTRVAGYGHAEALAYLSAMTPDARAAYLGPERILDTALPLGVFGLLALLPRLGPWPRLAAVALVPALAYLALDLWENAAIAGLLRADPAAVTPAAVAQASRLTQAKFAALGVAALIALIALAGRARVWLNRGP
jgi:hypothetical protein